MKVPGSTREFPPWGSGRRTENPRGFDFEGQWDLMTELAQDWGNRFLEGTHKTLCAPGTRKKGAVTPRETEPDLPVSVQESSMEAWADSGLPGGQGH